MKILCVGAGATGGYFGGRLVEARSADVTFLVRERRNAQLERDGLVIDSPFGDARLRVTTTLQAKPAGYDIVLLTCKAYDLPAAIDAIRTAVEPRTAVLPLLNGLSHLELLNSTFGRERVLGGMAQIHVGMLADGTIKHFNDWRYINFGEQTGGTSERVTALKAAFTPCGDKVIATIVPNVLQRMWEKIVLLATLAGMTCLMRANVGEIVRAPGGKELALTMLERNAGAAAAAGFAMGDDFLANTRKIYADPDNDFTASLLRDIERQGPVEADHIVGFMLDKVREAGLPTELHQAAYTHLKAYEERRKAGRL